jgi:hypothetical protein
MGTDKMEEMIDRALADGQLSTAESEMIEATLYGDGQVAPEQMQLFRELQEKVWQGDVMLGEWRTVLDPGREKPIKIMIGFFNKHPLV